MVGTRPVYLVEMNGCRIVGLGHRFCMQDGDVQGIGLLAASYPRCQYFSTAIADCDIKNAVFTQDVAHDLVEDYLILAEKPPLAAAGEIRGQGLGAVAQFPDHSLLGL